LNDVASGGRLGVKVEIELADWKMLFLYLTSKLAGRERISTGGEMDVSKQKQLKEPQADPAGAELIQQLVSASGLPEAAVHSELSEICAVAGTDPGNMTLDELRAAMLSYLEQLERESASNEN
jgi:hypothetical protein